MATAEVESIKEQSRKLLPAQKIELIKFLADSLAPNGGKQEPRYLVYGEFSGTPGRQMSTEEDLKIAEWHPTETELSGE